MSQGRFIFNMQAKNLILTIAHGDLYSEMAKLTHPSLRAYASKINADFLCITQRKISKTSIHWEKFQIFDLLNDYDRILFIDTDIIIRDDCPNLFEIVPKDSLGMFNEAPWTDRSKELLIDCCRQYGVTLSGWDGKYYNTGMMVIGRSHKYLFKKPEKEYCSFYEQTYLNMTIAEQVNKKELKMFELEYRYNRMCCMDSVTGEDRHASYVIHYAGFPNPDLVLNLIKTDLKKWESLKGNYKFKKHIAVLVSGGLGDQADAEPAIRFMLERVYPNEDVSIYTHWPRLFSHLKAPVYKHQEHELEFDTPYFIVNTLPGPETLQWMIVSNLMCHTVDYCSMALLKRTLPLLNKTIQLSVNTADFDNLRSIVKDDALEDLILVHPGRHWQSKTLPAEYWQEIIDLLAKDHKICIIGKDECARGTVDVKCPGNAYDLRNLLDLGSLIALISRAKILISNDSAPVHIAGAFDNWVVLIPTCKHPDHVLPYRHGNPYHKSVALYKNLPSDEFNAEPTCVHGSSAEFTQKSWDYYLLSPKDVIEKINEISHKGA